MKENMDDKFIIDKVKDGIDFLDHAVPSKTPDISQFRKLVADVEVKKQIRKKNEIFIFLISAILILSIETFTFSQSVTLFAVVQIAALVSFPLSIIGWKKYQIKQVKPQ